MSSFEYLNGQKQINPDKKRAGTIEELVDSKTIKVRSNTYKRLLGLKEKLHYQLNVTKGKIPSFDFTLNFLMDERGFRK